MDICFICMESLDDTFFLPINEKYFDKNISIFKNSFIVKHIDNNKFLYLLICNICVNKYLKTHGKIYKYLINREIGYK